MLYKLFSLNLTLTVISGIEFTCVSFLFPGFLADLLGASPELREKLVVYRDLTRRISDGI